MCSEPLLIPNFEPFKIHYFYSHFRRLFDSSKLDSSKLGIKSSFKTLKLGIKSNLNHVMRENDYKNNEF